MDNYLTLGGIWAPSTNDHSAILAQGIAGENRLHSGEKLLSVRAVEIDCRLLWPGFVTVKFADAIRLDLLAEQVFKSAQIVGLINRIVESLSVEGNQYSFFVHCPCTCHDVQLRAD
jgi:hypothetical protein